MHKVSYINTMPYHYDPAHSGAHYHIGKTYKNHGEFLESVAKFHRGLDYMKNPPVPYDQDSDIPSLNASIKSSGATLADVFGASVEEILAVYAANVHSTLFIYMVDIDDTITEYHMNKDEFLTFTHHWAGLARDSGTYLTKVRFKKTSGKMIKWLEKNCE